MTKHAKPEEKKPATPPAPDPAQPPSGLRPDLDKAGKDSRGGDGGGVGKSL